MTQSYHETSQLNFFKYIGGVTISKKVIPNLSIDEEISLWGNGLVLSGFDSFLTAPPN